MLSFLHVKNIALIDEIYLELGNHLNIFSGETGAGKSMLIDSIQFAIGIRTTKQIIRKGQQYAYVKLGFKDTYKRTFDFLEEQGIGYDDENITIERILYQSGRTVYKINGYTSTRQVVKDVAALLIDVHGQHEPQSLLDVSKHIHMLDSFGDEAFLAQKLKYKEAYERYYITKAEIDKIAIDDRKRLQMHDMLVFQINEINRAKLKIGEEETLKADYEILSHAEKIINQCQKAYDALESGRDGESGATALVGQGVSALQDVSGISNELEELHKELLGIEAQLQEVSYAIRKYTDTIDYSPENLSQTQERLDTIYRLKQKYGSSISEILTYKAKCEEELNDLNSGEENKEKLSKELIEMEKELTRLGESLSEKRKMLATRIEKEIDHHLHDLQMPHAEFKVSITLEKGFSRWGMDSVEFLIRTNLGEDVHSLSKIASGGEISRVMLAIKTVLVLGDTIETVIFDEIDTGISGLAAQKVAEKLGTIARERQVICITHLPQIAAMGDQNYLIEKHIEEDQTKTALKRLEAENIEKELCRLMGGLITDSTLQSAKELKMAAEKYKEI